MICFILFVFSVLFGEGEAAAYKPTDVFLINCGATSNTSDTNGRTWTPEPPKDFASNLVNASFAAKNYEIDLVPYRTARVFLSNFTYNFPVSPGWKFLRLYFYQLRYDLDNIFSVTVNGFTLLRNFNPDLTAKASGAPNIVKEFIVPVLGGDKTLNLTFTPSPHSLAFINGVEIVSMPDRFYTKGGFDDSIESFYRF